MPHYNFYTYILTNFNKTVLYTGVTNDLERRLSEHYFGIDQKETFTSKYKCFFLCGLKDINTSTTLLKEKRR